MDGLHDDTPLAHIFHVWERFEQVVLERPWSSALTSLALMSLIRSRQYLDVLAIIALVSWLGGISTPFAYRNGTHVLIGACVLISVVFIGLAWCSRRTKPDRTSHLAIQGHPQTPGRRATSLEITLEGVFKRYLGDLVRQSSSSIVIEYNPAGVSATQSTVFLSKPGEVDAAKMIFNVLTPEFYTRFVHYAHDSEAIFSELAESRTISVDRPELLPEVFLKKGSKALHAQTLVDFLCFELIRKLRRRPRSLARSSPANAAGTRSMYDIRGFRISSMDAYVLAQDDSHFRQSYRTTVLRLFIADRYLGGSHCVVTTALVALRLLAWWGLALLFTNTLPLT